MVQVMLLETVLAEEESAVFEFLETIISSTCDPKVKSNQFENLLSAQLFTAKKLLMQSKLRERGQTKPYNFCDLFGKKNNHVFGSWIFGES